MCLKSQHSQIEILAHRLEWKWSQDKPIRIVFTCFVCVCVDDVVRLGLEPWRGCIFSF